MPAYLDSILEKSPFRRLVPSLYRRIGPLLYGDKLIVRRYGFLFLLDQSNLIDNSMLYRFGWEGSKYSRFMDYWKASAIGGSETIFLDIGAHWALYAIRASGEANISRICAFEPDPRNKTQLACNLFLNALVDRIEVFDCAVSNEDGEVALLLAPAKNRGVTKISHAPAASDANVVTVCSERLDSRFPERDRNYLIKMDVEGVELDALKGMREMLSANKAILMIETNGGLKAVSDYLATLGYEHVAVLHDKKGEDDHLFSNVG